MNSNQTTHREVHHRWAVRQTTLGVLFHRHGHRADLHLHLRIKTPDPWLFVADLARQREGAANEHLRAAGRDDRDEVAAVEGHRSRRCDSDRQRIRHRKV